MYKNKRILALIPARGGSKGLPGKNISFFCGKPLISWTIAEAQKSRYLDKVMVTTDDQTIAKISLKYGACVPFLRPKKLATSTSSIIDVIMHALDFFRKRKKDEKYEIIVLLQPTSPLRTTDDIDRSIELFFRKKACAVVSFCRSEHHPWWSALLSKDSRVEKFIAKGKLHTNRQNLPAYYRINGAVYVAQSDYFKRSKGFFGQRTFAYIMPPERSVDIDNVLDFRIAGFFKHNIKKGK